MLRPYDEIKKHSRTSPDVQFKEFSVTKQTIRHRMIYERTGKTISRKIRSEKSKKNKINVKMPFAGNGNLVKTKKD